MFGVLYSPSFAFAFSQSRHPPVAISMNDSTRLFVQHVVIAVPKVVSRSIGQPIHTVAELRQQIHEDLRRQHPEWIQPGGESPMCDFYEERLSRLLQTCAPSAQPKLLNL
jgi:hypothetical protein